MLMSIHPSTHKRKLNYLPSLAIWVSTTCALALSTHTHVVKPHVPPSLSCSDGTALDSARMRRSPPASALAAGEAVDDDAKEADNGVDDGLDTGCDGVDNGHDAVADCPEDGLDLLDLLVTLRVEGRRR
jgi:hypothetical protein